MAVFKRSNIVGQTFEISFQANALLFMFDLLATSKNIARLAFLACIEQKMFFNFFKNMMPHILLTFVCQAMFDRFVLVILTPNYVILAEIPIPLHHY